MLPGADRFDPRYVVPERLRGVRYNGPVNWEAFDLSFERNGLPNDLKKRYWKAKIKKAIQRHGIECLTPAFRENYVRARLYLGDFSDYWGWEFRNLHEDNGHFGSLYWDETWLPKWGGGYVDRLLILGEQGLGDEIFFASIIPEAMIRCREVIYECDPRLHSLLERSLRGLKCRPRTQFEDRRESYGPIDAFAPAAELMRMFRRRKVDFPGVPYLKADPGRVKEFEPYRGRTGIAWRARQGELPAGDLPVSNPVALQYGERDERFEYAKLDLWADVEGMVALCSVLKEVVTVPQTIHHIAAAVGTTTHIVLPSIPGAVENGLSWDYSREIDHGRLPWYGSARVHASIEDLRNALEAQ